MKTDNPEENGRAIDETLLTEQQVDVQVLRNRDFPLVGIGGSAGAFGAFGEFFASVPPDSGAAFVVVQHLDPSVKSMLPELLQRHTPMPVVRVKDGLPVAPNHIYVIPENTEMALFGGRLLLLKPSRPRGLRMPIDTFFQSLAADWGEKAVAIIFSGMGTDGELGARFVKQGLGLVIAQRLDTAEYESMPRTLIESGLADYVEAPGQMAGKLFEFLKRPYRNMQHKDAFASPKVANALHKVLLLLRGQTGHDFSLYKKNTLYRRLERRMNTLQLESLEEYVTYLQHNQEEVKVLFKDFLIGVTRFFRDYPAFQLLEEKILPELLGKKKPKEAFRAWIAGCSTGEEAYSIAILVREYLEKSQFRSPVQVQIFATDLDPGAIEKARKGQYYSNMGADMSRQRLDRWFTREGDFYQVNQEIREMIVFAEHNMTRDPAFTKLDLLCCRNVFIYFTPELQKKLLPVFHYTLSPGGVLFLGPAENVDGLNEAFETLDVKWKLYRRRETSSALAGLLQFPGQGLPKHLAAPAPAAPEEKKPGGPDEALRDVLLEEYTPPALLIDGQGEIRYVNGRTGRYLELRPGGGQLNLFTMAREGLAFELRSAVQEALSGQTTVIVPRLKVNSDGLTRLLRLTVRYLGAPPELKGLLLVLLEELPRPRKERKTAKAPDFSPDAREAEALAADNKRLRNQLQQLREEKDVTVEELRSANEELQSTNEELQSTNEEAISAKEELQSLNEELMTVNLELREKSDQLTEVNNDMTNLLNSSQIATVFVDNDLQVKRFTPAATAVFHLVPSDEGRPLAHIRSRLRYEGLEQQVREVIQQLVHREVEVATHDGKYYQLRILPYRTTDHFIDGAVLTLVDISPLKTLQARQQASQQLAENIIDSVRDPMLVLDGQLRVVAVSRAFSETFRVAADKTKGKLLFELGNGQWDIPQLRERLENITRHGEAPPTVLDDVLVEHTFPRIGLKKLKLHARHLVNQHGDQQDHLVLLTLEDVTGRER